MIQKPSLRALKRDPVDSDDHAIQILNRMCKKTIESFGEETRPLAISFDRNVTP